MKFKCLSFPKKKKMQSTFDFWLLRLKRKWLNERIHLIYITQVSR